MSSIALGLDRKQRPRAVFFYDGGCGVCKFLVGFVCHRDATDHFRFSPIQTKYATAMCEHYKMPIDVSTAVLIDEKGGHTHSSSVLLMFAYMGFPYVWLGIVALLVPAFIRDFAYRTFARNRGAIWKGVKRVTGMGNTRLDDYRDRILGLEEPVDPSWGFEAKKHQ
jgi:predicted DCC family thiol-disulfide oxidoreductase YuxK